MTTPDFGHQLTDKELAVLEKRITAVYRLARDELQDTVTAYFESFAKRDEEMKNLIGSVVNGKEWTQADYKQWRLAQIGRGERFEVLRDKLAERMTKANETAAAYVNDATPGIYSLNRNYAAYTIEQAAGDIGFTLWDEQTVKRLLMEQPDLMPCYPPQKAVKRGVDLAYGKKQITASVTGGILQGKSIKGLADDLQTRIPAMNRDSAVRTARTAVTGAQNAGRMDSYAAAQKIGIKLQKEWLATLDGRTRHSHAMLDGERIESDGTFSNGCRFPGDPQGPPGEVYNCRCTLVAYLPDVDTSDAKRRVRDPVKGESEAVFDMTYTQWEASKRAEKIVSDVHKKYLDGMTMNASDGIISEDDLRAIDLYRSSYSYILNEKLRDGEKLSDKEREAIRSIDWAISKLPKYEGTVYRSLDSSVMDLDAFWERYAPGEFVLENAYTSSSTEIYDDSMKIQMAIQSKHGCDMRQYNPNEQEILFKRGTTFFVEKREGNTLWLTEA